VVGQGGESGQVLKAVAQMNEISSSEYCLFFKYGKFTFLYHRIVVFGGE
jgi:hypothetical protein